MVDGADVGREGDARRARLLLSHAARDARRAQLLLSHASKKALACM
jgi:hypothetical protein